MSRNMFVNSLERPIMRSIFDEPLTYTSMSIASSDSFRTSAQVAFFAPGFLLFVFASTFKHAVVDEVKAQPAFPVELDEAIEEVIAPPAFPVELVEAVERSGKMFALLRLVSAKFFTLPIAAFDPSSEVEKG